MSRSELARSKKSLFFELRALVSSDSRRFGTGRCRNIPMGSARMV